MLNQPIAKGLLRADATGIAFNILVEFYFKRSTGHGVRLTCATRITNLAVLYLTEVYFTLVPIR
jgi:hypothetical protein